MLGFAISLINRRAIIPAGEGSLDTRDKKRVEELLGHINRSELCLNNKAPACAMRTHFSLLVAPYPKTSGVNIT